METQESREDLFSNRSKNLPSSFIRNILKFANQPDDISFAGGLPDPALFPLEELQKCAMESFRLHGTSLLQYSKSEGLPALKDWICNYYLEKFQMAIQADQLLITNGSQQALDLIGKAFLDPGDQIILEQPSYLGAIQAFMAYEPEILPVPITTDGVELEVLELLLLQYQPKFLYLVPNFQNPSGFSISLEKRKQLAELAELHQLLIIEDDPYGQLRFEGTDLYPIYSFYPNTILCGSLSKIVAPGLRIGWILAEERIIQKLLVFKQASDLHSNNISQYMAAHFLQNYSFENHLERIRDNYRHKGRKMYEAVKRFFPLNCNVNIPEGGMFLWVELPEYMDAELVLQQCMVEKVLFVPGKYFYTNGKGGHTLRLNFTNTTVENIEKGIAVLGKKISEMYGKANEIQEELSTS